MLQNKKKGKQYAKIKILSIKHLEFRNLPFK